MNEVNRDPGLAAVFSFVFSGLGQIYNGEITKGLLIIFLSSVSIFVVIMGGILICFWLLGKILSLTALSAGLALFIAGLISICILGIYSIFDAYKVACKK